MNTLIHLLRVLRAAGELLTPEETLRSDLRSSRPGITGCEVTDAFTEAEAKGLAICGRDVLTGRVSWKITGLGRAALAERGQ